MSKYNKNINKLFVDEDKNKKECTIDIVSDCEIPLMDSNNIIINNDSEDEDLIKENIDYPQSKVNNNIIKNNEQNNFIKNFFYFI